MPSSLVQYTRPRIPIGYEPRLYLIICVISVLSALPSFAGTILCPSVSSVSFSPIRNFDREQFISPYCHHRNIIPPASHFHSPPYLHHITHTYISHHNYSCLRTKPSSHQSPKRMAKLASWSKEMETTLPWKSSGTYRPRRSRPYKRV